MYNDIYIYIYQSIYIYIPIPHTRQATQSASLALKLISEEQVAVYLAACPEERFNVEHQRKLR